MTNHIFLREVRVDDLPIFFEQQLDPDAIRMAAFPSRDRDSFMVHWTKILADETNIIKTIVFDGRVAGNIVSFEMFGEREVGYWLGKEYWGKGITTRALSEFLRIIKQRPLYAHVAKHNLASYRVLEKCGFTSYTVDMASSNTDGEEVEEYILILTA